MNKYGVLTTDDELLEADVDDYETLRNEGTFRLLLNCRSWYSNGRSYGLICYFEDSEGELYQIFCFRHKVDGKEIYNPKNSKINFAEVTDGTLWDITMAKNKKGRTEWVDAVLVG